MAWGAPSLMPASTGRPGSGDADVAGAAAWSGSAAAAASAGEGWMAPVGGEGAEGAVSVLALASGSFLDRGPLRSVFVQGVSGRFA